MKNLHFITFLLLVIGGVNWLLFGLFGWELGAELLGGNDSTLSMILYVLVGLSALYEFATHKKNCAACKAGKK